MRLKRTYSSREVAAMTGLTARQLQLWDAGGLLSPAIPSHRPSAGGYTERRYTPIELFELLVLADSPSRLLGPSAPHDPADPWRSVRDASVRSDRRRRSGRAADRRPEIYARTRTGQFFNLLKTPAQPLLVIGDEGLLKELSGKVKPRRKKPRRPLHEI